MDLCIVVDSDDTSCIIILRSVSSRAAICNAIRGIRTSRIISDANVFHDYRFVFHSMGVLRIIIL